MQGASPSPGQEPFHTPSSQDAPGPFAPKAKWWKVHLFRGMVKDIKRRVPFYWSDWLDAWDYRVVPATVYMFFAKYVYFYPPFPLPAHTISNMAYVVFYPLWHSHWTCLRRQTRAME